MHAVCVAGLGQKKPAAHCVCVSEFDGQYIPRVHAWHTVLAVALHAVVWYVPAAHTKQAVGAVLPATQKLLAGQLVWVAGVGQ